jgi:hypothetical protein
MAEAVANPQNPFDRPVFIVAAPRSGSTLLFETLASGQSVWTIGGESHRVFEGIPALQVGLSGHDSNRLTEVNASRQVITQLRSRFLNRLVSSNNVPYWPTSENRVRLLEKTPKNALRIPFLDTVFPDARYIVLFRNPRENISSIIEGWRSGRFVTYKNLPHWGAPWSFLLPPGYGALRDHPLEDVAAFQWHATNSMILDDLAKIPGDRWTAVSYDAFLAKPIEVTRRLCAFMLVNFDSALLGTTSRALAPSRYTLTQPARDKWKKNEALITRVLPRMLPLQERITALLAGYESGSWA